eukprot:SAG31_NODE_410_length_15989_cov_237.233984_10_plen_174_part_00
MRFALMPAVGAKNGHFLSGDRTLAAASPSTAPTACRTTALSRHTPALDQGSSCLRQSSLAQFQRGSGHSLRGRLTVVRGLLVPCAAFQNFSNVAASLSEAGREPETHARAAWGDHGHLAQERHGQLRATQRALQGGPNRARSGWLAQAGSPSRPGRAAGRRGCPESVGQETLP